MHDYQWATTCDEPDCDCCRLGARLVAAMQDADVDVPTVVLTLVRLLATIAASAPPKEQVRVFTGMVNLLREDVVLLTTAAATDVPEVH